jgi:hypothetical protein
MDAPTQVSNSKASKRPLLVIGIVLAAVLLVVGGWVAYKKTSVKSDRNYTYSRMDAYTMAGTVDKSGMSFSKPVELVKVLGAPGGVALEHRVNTKDGKLLAASINATTTTLQESVNKSQLPAFNSVMTLDTNEGHKAALQPIQDFLKTRTPAKWELTINNVKEFKSSYIKEGAWIIDYSTKDPGIQMDPWRGNAIYAVSDKNAYYFMIFASSHNWQANDKIWQQVLSSIKFDQ